VDEFVNADVIQKAARVSEVEAGRRTLARLDELMRARRNIAFETTLSSRMLLPRIESMQRAGYLLHLIFFWLPGADMAIERVARRVASGGHSIPKQVIRRRYERGLQNLFSIYLGIADSWQLLNNTDSLGRSIAWRDVGRRVVIADQRIWNTLVATYMKPRVEQPSAWATALGVTWTSQDVLEAVNDAVAEALRRHKERGESVVVWRDGKIVTLQPEEIDV
jgi:predicted ABC-type ATPase